MDVSTGSAAQTAQAQLQLQQSLLQQSATADQHAAALLAQGTEATKAAVQGTPPPSRGSVVDITG